MALSKSISDQRANLSSLERMKMSNVSFTANFVSFLPLKLLIRSGQHISLLPLFFAVIGKQLPIARKLQQP